MNHEESLNEEHQFAGRLIAVLDYDGIPKHRRAAFLANAGKISRSTAYRLLKGSRAAWGWRIPAELIRALDVSRTWLIFGELSSLDLRTMRIHLQTYKGYPKEDTNRIMRMLVGYIAGHNKAENLLNLAAAGELSFTGAARLL